MSRYFRITQKGYEGMSSIKTTEKIDDRLQELIDKEVIPFLAVQHYPTMLYSIIEILDDNLDSEELFKLLKIKDYRQTTEEEISFENRLKEIQTICNIKKNLHFHLFRKTYATRLINKGVRLETVSKALGHSSTAITQQTYSKLLKKTVIDEIKAVF